jgi:Bacterial Ig-like domain (group 2)
LGQAAELFSKPKLVFLCLMLAVLCGCGASSNPSAASFSKTLSSLSVTAASSSIAVGAQVQLTATAIYSDDSTAVVTSSATWSSSSNATATVSSSGLAVGVAAGSATITASFQGVNGVSVSGNTSLTVTGSGKPVTGLAINPTNASIHPTGQQQLTATATYSDGTTGDVTTSAAWTSSDNTIATVGTGTTTPGLATGVAPGSVDITASFQNVKADTILNVATTGGTITAFQVSATNPSIAPGRTLQLISRVLYSDNSALEVTSSTTWTSSNPAVVTVQTQNQGAPGQLSGLAAGTSTITASYNGNTTTSLVTVAANAVPVNLLDMTSSQNYLGFAGGLYENSSSRAPSDHDAAGIAAGTSVQPLDHTGNPASNGAVVFLSIGMSNATIEFSAFQAQALSSPSVNHTTLALEDGAEGGVLACSWTVAQGLPATACPGVTGVRAENQYDRVRDTVLAVDTSAPTATAGCGAPPASPCLTEAQVEAIWIKEANAFPGTAGTLSLCDASTAGCVNSSTNTEALKYESQLGQIIRAAKSRYPNLKQVFLSTRIYAGYATTPLNPEPYAYEYGYSAKWLIEAQILQTRNGTVDPVAGDLNYSNGTGAWTAWGTYIWADGTNARSDGLAWLSTDYQSDGTHPNATGQGKVATQLMNFFTTSAYTPWFRP